MKGSLVIVSFFLLGTFFGFNELLPASMGEGEWSYYALCALMFCVGVSIGHDPHTLRSFRSLNPRYILLPLVTVAGTFAGCAAVSFILQHSAIDCMAVGAGFGYYSLSSIVITEYKGPELGTIALLANILREILTLLLAPLFVRYFGKLAPISIGGATTEDTTLGIITRSCGQEYVVVSIYHGVVIDFFVPFCTTFLCTLSF